MNRNSIRQGGLRSSAGPNLGAMEKLYSQSRTTPRILLADDDQTTSELLRSIDSGENYQVVSVADGREAFRLLRTDARFNLAIFNMTIPHLQGIQILNYMKTEKRLMRIPVVLISGDGNLNVVAEGFAAGAIAFLAKPFNPDQLQRIVQLVLSTRDSKRIQRAA